MVDRRTQIKIAHWYYEKGFTQAQIADKLQISRQRVNKIVNSLVEEGIVTIKINGLDQQYVELENTIENHFNLKQVVIADCDQPGTNTLHAMGAKAAEFLDDYIQDKTTIGISWGLTLGEAISNMRQTRKPNCQVVQLVGGLHSSNHMVRPDEITRMLARKLRCDYHNLYAPAFLDSDISHELITQEESVHRVFELMESCDMAIVGIGELSTRATVVEQGYLSQEELTALREFGCVGDICFNHFTLDWRLKALEVRSTIGVGYNTLKRIPNVIAICGGLNKVDAIMGALNTGCIDILITDSCAARALAARL